MLFPLASDVQNGVFLLINLRSPPEICNKISARYEQMQLACNLIVMVYLYLKVLVATIDAQWEGMGDVGSARYEPAQLPPYPTIRVLSYSN